MAGEIKADQGGSVDGENDPAEVAVATTAAYGDDGEGAPVATGACGGMVKKQRLSDAEVKSILFRERREFSPDTSNMSEEEVEIMCRAVEAFNVVNDNFAEYQAEVRVEYEAKGYVEVDGDLFSEEERQWLQERLAHLFDDLDFSDVQEEEQKEEVDYNNESEEEGEAEMSPESKFE